MSELHSFGWFVFPALLLLLLGTTLHAQDVALNQYSAAIHVHSTFSNGEHSVVELARFARERNVDVLLLTDSFLTSVTYGIWPFDRIGIQGLNRLVRPAVRDHGIGEYFAAVEEAQRKFPGLIILPGVEVTPYYYWTGTPWQELVLHDFDRHLIIFGLAEGEIGNLPVIGNASWTNTHRDWRLILFPALLFLLGVSLLFVTQRKKIRLRYYVIEQRRRLWTASMFPMVLGLLMAWNNYPFGVIGDPYSGGHDIRPYQRLIDYVRDKSGLVYWSYPEARYDDVEAGGARMISRPHPQDLLVSDRYHGFEGIYGDRITVTLPGRMWDRVLLHYIEGKRLAPPFVTTGIDFHYFRPNRGRWFNLDGGQTILMMPEKTRFAVLDALRNGRCYATFQGFDERLRLHDFSVETAEGHGAIQGGEIHGKSPIKVYIHLDWLEEAPENDEPFVLELIRNGELVDKIEQFLPVQTTLSYRLEPGPFYFRLRASWKNRLYRVLSNPIFVNVR